MRAPTYQPQTEAPSGSQVRLIAPDRSGVGKGIAEAFQSTAQGLGAWAESELRIQERHNDIHSRKLALEYEKQGALILAEYFTLQGEDAIKAQPQVKERLEKLRDELRSAAGNERMRFLFDVRTDEPFVRDINSTVEYSTKAQFKMDLDVTRGEMETYSLEASNNWQKPLAHQASLAKVRAAAEREADMLGLTGDAANVAIRERVSTAILSTIAAMAADPEFVEGDMMAYFDAMQDQMTLEHRTRASSVIQPLVRNRMADALISRIASGLPVGEADDETADGSIPSPAGAAAGGGAVSSAPARAATLVPRQRPVQGQITSTFSAHLKRGSAGLDIAAPAGTPIKPVAEGTVVETGKGGTGGNYIRVRHDDGTMTSYMHMARPTNFKRGDRVTPADTLGVVGRTGRSTGPHLHLEVKDAQGKQIDPEPYLQGAVPLGKPDDPQKWDAAAILREIDRLEAAGTISLEQADLARNRMMQRANRDEQIIAMQERQATDAINDWLVNNGKIDSFTSIDQLPPSLRALPGFTSNVYMKYYNMAKANEGALAAGSKGGSPDALEQIEGLLVLNPDAIYDPDLIPKFAPRLTQSDLAKLQERQRKAIDARESNEITFDAVASTKIASTIDTLSKMDGVKYAEGSDNRASIASLMYKFVLERFRQNGGKPLTDADYHDAYRYATEKVEAVWRDGIYRLIGPTKGEAQRFEIKASVKKAQETEAEDRAARARRRADAARQAELRSKFRQAMGREPYDEAELESFAEALR